MNKLLIIALLLGIYSAGMSTYLAVRDTHQPSQSARLEVYHNIPDARARELVASNPRACEHQSDQHVVTCSYR